MRPVLHQMSRRTPTPREPETETTRAHAEVARSQALDRHPNRADRVNVFTFGEPPYGDATFFQVQKQKHPKLPHIYDRRVAVTVHPKCKTDIVPETTRLAGGGGHFADPHFVCADDAPKNVLAAHSMVGYYRGMRDHAKRDFHLNFTYDGPGFWGSDTPDDPLLLAELEKLRLAEIERRRPPRKRARFFPRHNSRWADDVERPTLPDPHLDGGWADEMALL